jgi:hypothetical protein
MSKWLQTCIQKKIEGNLFVNLRIQNLIKLY